MEEESSLNEVIQDSPRDLKLEGALRDQRDKSPESLTPDQGQQSLHSSLDPVPVQDEESTEDEVGHNKCPPAPRQDQLGFQGADQNPASGEEPDLSQVYRQRPIHVQDQFLLQSQDPSQRVDLDRGKEEQRSPAGL